MDVVVHTTTANKILVRRIVENPETSTRRALLKPNIFGNTHASHNVELVSRLFRICLQNLVMAL